VLTWHLQASYNDTVTDDSGDDSDGSAASSTYDYSAASSTYAPGSSAATSTYVSAEPTQVSWGPGSGFPEDPAIVQPDLSLYGGGSLSGYFFKDLSLAVLSMPSFQETGDAMNTFSSTVRDFLAASKASGMQKVLIDLQQNYGGDTLLAFDAFKHFFPQIEPYGGSWLRAHPPADIIGDMITTYWDGLTPDYDDYFNLLNSEWVSSDRIDAATNRNFSSWQQFFGPQQLNGDNFTTVVSCLFSLISIAADDIHSNDTT
jgi:Peptidase family S41